MGSLTSHPLSYARRLFVFLLGPLKQPRRGFLPEGRRTRTTRRPPCYKEAEAAPAGALVGCGAPAGRRSASLALADPVGASGVAPFDRRSVNRSEASSIPLMECGSPPG